MRHIRRVFSNVNFEHSVLTKLIFGGQSMGTFVKDGIIFHRCSITFVDLEMNNISCRWLGMIPSESHIQDFKGDYSFTLPNMKWKEELHLQPFYLSHRYRMHLPCNIRAEDELIIGRIGNPYAPEMCPLR